MDSNQVVEWVKSASEDDVAKVRAACEDRLHEIKHGDEHGAGGGLKDAGYKPVTGV